MSVLLRHPATVPTLFARAVEDEPVAPVAPRHWRRLMAGVPLVAISGWAAVMLIDVPLVKAGTLIVSLALAR